MIETADGDRPIEEIQIGDLVLSANPETGEIAYKPVVNTYVHVTDTVLYLTIDEEIIETTEDHPFWVEGQGWTSAKLLQPGDVVWLKDGSTQCVDDIEIVELPEGEYVAVYNFEVADFHTYFVSDYDVLVHNNCKRNSPGTVAGGENLTNPARSMKNKGSYGMIPKDVADELRGKSYNNFDEFRSAFWKSYGNSKYSSEFKKSNIKRMQKGLAPFAPKSQWYGKQSKYVLHHKTPIQHGGGVYDLDNLMIVSPKKHQSILPKSYHFGKG